MRSLNIFALLLGVLFLTPYSYAGEGPSSPNEEAVSALKELMELATSEKVLYGNDESGNRIQVTFDFHPTFVAINFQNIETRKGSVIVVSTDPDDSKILSLKAQRASLKMDGVVKKDLATGSVEITQVGQVLRFGYFKGRQLQTLGLKIIGSGVEISFKRGRFLSRTQVCVIDLRSMAVRPHPRPQRPVTYDDLIMSN